ncbi:TerB family tellurite resistance protein [Paracrocinitomix mangrovi]|uniref:tellurite resistance TerB family protein n=1 Tax=Paracrocinitomix mangrovi TaxID=2862509 RepID=UPI001C8E07D5|nr:TerB family tellurite resistance protein [Paracrocinitomix mangrovi]UKN02934.1 TerB family tellurite resistance protein [Paracrocinitomix mangrovi]
MDEKKSLISQLIELSKVDGYVDEMESGLIKTMGNMIGLSDDEILALFEKPAPFNPPTSHIERIIQFHRLVLLMNVDGEISPNELQMIKLSGIKLGLDEDAIKEVLNRMHDYPNNVIPPDELIRIFTKNMN